MHQHQEKISNFVTHLLSNPNIKNEPALIAEGVVLNFIVSNLEKLKITFQSPQFFPGVPVNEVLALIIGDLRNRTITEIKPSINAAIDSIDFSVLAKFQKNAYSSDYYNQIFKSYIKEVMQNKDARLTFHAALNIYKVDALEKYIGISFSRRSPIFFELVRVQKNNLRTEEYVNYLKTLLLLRGAALIKEEIPQLSTTKVNINNFTKEQKYLDQFFTIKAKLIEKQLPGIHPHIIQMALKSNLSESFLKPEDSSARFIYLITQRFQNYQEYKKIDRGAETPDKSWFGVMRKNAKFYGFDKRLLEDLYMIAGDNNW